jgi:hypothetical protein
MAAVKLHTGQVVNIKDKEKAYSIWRVLTREEEGTEEQQAFCATVAAIYLNRKDPDCPKSYLADRASVHALMDKGSVSSTSFASVMGVRK